MHKYAKFDLDIPNASRVMSIFTTDHGRTDSQQSLPFFNTPSNRDRLAQLGRLAQLTQLQVGFVYNVSIDII